MSTLTDEIKRLKEERHAVILAHNYVRPEVQDIADFTGDSLELSIKAKAVNAEVIVFCGVRFMAETAKLLSPQSMVLLPNSDAGCPMADMADPEPVANYRKAHPDAIFVAYVNSTAAVKAQVDICCTSGNAENIQNVFKVAGGLGIRRILFTGNRHGKCERYADCVIAVPESETYRIQELHLPVYHAVCIMLEEYFYGK